MRAHLAPLIVGHRQARLRFNPVEHKAEAN